MYDMYDRVRLSPIEIQHQIRHRPVFGPLPSHLSTYTHQRNIIMDIAIDNESTIITVPQDVVNSIVDEILFLDLSALPRSPIRFPYRSTRTKTLQAWSTICRAFVHPCQKHLFYSRRYDTYRDYKAQNSFCAFRSFAQVLVHTISRLG